MGRSPHGTWRHQRAQVGRSDGGPLVCAHAPHQCRQDGAHVRCAGCDAELTKEVPMVKVRLETREGEYVATVDVLPMDPMPDMLLWGSRYFQRASDDRYREGFCYAVPLAQTR